MIRRIRRSEQEVLANLCSQDSHWKKYFTAHNTWLTKALADVASQDRVVFGYFDTVNHEGDKVISPLIGCLFLKLSQFDNSIEFKNLILPSYNFKDPKTIEITNGLIDNAVRFCEVRNILKIEIELPQEEHELISTFLSQNFKLVALRERYGQGKFVCTLERSIGETYYGDPFDILKLSYWLLRSYMPCEIVDKTFVSGISKISFIGKSLSKAFSDQNPVGKDKLVRGTMWVLPHLESMDENLDTVIKQSDKHPLTLLLANYELPENSKEALRKEGIIYFDKSELLAISGDNKSALNIPIEPENVNGIITVLEQEQIINYAKKDSLTYYLLSGLHDGLNGSEINPSDENHVPLILAIYCPNWFDKGPGIVGCSIIKDISRPIFKNLLKKELPPDSALSQQDLSFYQTYSEDERIGQLSTTKVVLFSEPVPIKESDSISSDVMRNYLINEIKINGSSSAYIDKITAKNLRKIADTKSSFYKEDENVKIKKEKEFTVGLSFPGEHRDFVKKVADELVTQLGKAKVFYDNNFKVRLAKTNLDLILGDIYRNECDVVVLFFSKEYESKKWCNLEWKYIREIIFDLEDDGVILPLKFDDVKIRGLLNHDGYIMINDSTSEEVAEMIMERVNEKNK